MEKSETVNNDGAERSVWGGRSSILLAGIIVCAVVVALLWALHPVPNRVDKMLKELSSTGVNERPTAEGLRVFLRERGFFWETDREQYALVRRRAVAKANHEGVTEVAPDVIRLLETDEDDGVRINAAFYLHRMAIDGTSPALRKALKNDPLPSVRIDAAWGIGRLREPGCVEALVAASSDPDFQVRAAVARGLGLTRTPQAIAALKSILAEERSLPVRVAAALGVAENGVRDEAVVSVLKEGAQSSNQQSFVNGVRGLKELGLPVDAYHWEEPKEEPPSE